MIFVAVTSGRNIQVKTVRDVRSTHTKVGWGVEQGAT